MKSDKPHQSPKKKLDRDADDQAEYHADDRPTGKKIERRKLADLIDHPRQADFFDDLSDYDLDALADDIARNGLRELIEILPDNKAGLPADTIISGHQRKRALVLNGKTATNVVVRYDLADADEATVERAVLEANQNRRHQDTLEKARVAVRLMEIEKGKPRGKLASGEGGDVRDRVGKAIGLSGRHLERYLRALRTPKEVQNAYRRRELTLVQAGNVSDLEQEQQEAIAQRISDGEEAVTVVGMYAAKSQKGRAGVATALSALAKSLERGHEALHDQLDDVTTEDTKKHYEVLRQAKGLIRVLFNKAAGSEQVPE